MSDYEIVELFPLTSDEDADSVVAFHNAISREKVSHHRDSTVEQYRAKNSLPGLEMRHFVTKNEQDEVIGLVITGQWTDGTNERLQWLQLGVRADARRQGIGRSLLGKALEVAKKSGRTMMTADSIDTIPAGRAFADAIGADVAMREVTNTVLTSAIDRSMLEEWSLTAPGRAPGYEVLVVDGLYDESFYEDVARLIVMAHEDMPFDDLDMEPMVTTAEILAERAKQLEGVLDRTTALARHVTSGQIVGYSGITVPVGEHETLQTTLTAVHRDHRGHALGKWIKAAAILRALDKYPEAIRLTTDNAMSNEPMIGINNEIGFKPEFEMIAHQATVDIVEKYIQSRVLP
jgi:GNAT superfamily N-acetyltransferase